HEQGDLARAADCYRRTLALQPRHANAANNLATVLKEQGLLAEAVAQYRAVVRLQPDHSLAWYHLSQFASEGRFQFTPEDIDRLKGYLADRRGSGMDRSQLGFPL